MSEFILACGSCLLAGSLTTIHPCPLTTNVASISFLSSMTVNRRKIVSVTFFFICGYLFAYLLLGILISSGLLSIPSMSLKLQRSFGLLLGPILIILGMLQADFFQLHKFYKGRIIKDLKTKKWTGIMVFPFGTLVALSFCPATAAIFFGLLIPLSIKYEQMILFPILYALGASLPIIFVSILISRGTLLNAKSKWIKILPVINGWILIILGIYLSIRRIY